MVKSIIKTWIYLSSTFGLVGLNFASASPLVNDLSACQIRDFIVRFVEHYPAIQNLFDFENIDDGLPYSGVIVHPERWPNFTAPGNSSKPYALLGDWKIQFGFDGTDYHIAAVEFTRRTYSGPCESKKVDCRRLVILLNYKSLNDIAIDQIDWYVNDFQLRRMDEIRWVSERIFYIEGSREYSEKIKLSNDLGGFSTYISEFEPRGRFEPFF